MFSARMRSSTKRTTRSLASWSNFLGMFQIFPSTQTEQNLGHFTARVYRHCSRRNAPTPHRHLRATRIHTHRQRTGLYGTTHRSKRRPQRIRENPQPPPHPTEKWSSRPSPNSRKNRALPPNTQKWINARPLAKAVAELQTLLNEFRDYYNTTRPHKALGRRTPHQAYTTGAKANPAHNPTQEWRTRNDVVWDNGKTTVRYAGKLFHLGIGRKWKRKKILMVIADNHVITSLAETGEVITEHYIDTSRNYQKPYWKQGDPPLGPE